MNKKFFSGDSIRQAVLQAARFFQIDPEEVAYREVERRHGFLRARRRAVIEVDTENPRHPAGEATVPAGEVDDRDAAPVVASPRAVEAAAAPTGSPAVAEVEAGSEAQRTAPSDQPPEEPNRVTERQPLAEGELAEAAREALSRLFVLGKLDLEAEIRQGDERLEVELRGADEEILLEDRGRLLLAIQHLLPRMLRGLTGESMPCWVDCDDFHEIRTEQLRDLAQRTATEVRNTRRSQMLEPMSPDERRIIHLTLADDPAVETISQGNGLFKRVQVRPQKLRPQGFDPYSR